MVSAENQDVPVSYVLRRVEPDLWKRVKSRAAYEGRTIRFVILELLRVYAKHGFHVVETFDTRRKD